MPLAFSKLPAFRVPFAAVPAAGRRVSSRFNAAAAAGPRRLLVIAGLAAAVVGGIVGLTFLRPAPPPLVRPGPSVRADAVPGGVHANPRQDDLALLHAQQEAARERDSGRSFTPRIVSGQGYVPKPGERPLLTEAPVAAAASSPPAAAPVKTVPVRTPAPARVLQVADRTAEQPDSRYKEALASMDKMMRGWGGRPPRTDVVLSAEDEAAPSAPPRGGVRAASTAAAYAEPAAAARAGRRRVLIPAGRGVQGHVVVGANSDAPGLPVVLEMDTGPLARTRLIGGFSREAEGLVIRGSRVAHGGQDINADWIVVAPDTMETLVASDVEQNLFGRFVLPAAARFVEGLGQALALSNSALIASPFGGATALQRLNLGQQLGIGAGAAAGRVGQALDQAAPRRSTVKVAKDAPVGILFLGDVAVAD